MSGKVLRRAALCLAMGACLSSMVAVQPAWAANNDGSIVGRSVAGSEVTVRNPATGFTRTVKADASGVGTYRVERFTLRPSYGAPIGSLVTRRTGAPRLHVIDLTKLAQRDDPPRP